MRHKALAVDYDGTLADGGRVPGDVLEALGRLRATGVKLVLVTGRELEELMGVFPSRLDLFEVVVAENGALLYRANPGGVPVERPLSSPPPPAFVSALSARGVGPLACGRIAIATLRPHEQTVLRVIREQGLELEIVRNRDAVMVLPSGVDKGTGLAAALAELGLSGRDVVGVGDAENDAALLAACDVGAAVANAVPALRERADVVLAGARGEGVKELCARLLGGELDGAGGEDELASVPSTVRVARPRALP